MFELAPELGREDAHDVVYAAAAASEARGIELREALLEVAHIAATDLPELQPEDYLGQAPQEAYAAIEAWRAQRETS